MNWKKKGINYRWKTIRRGTLSTLLFFLTLVLIELNLVNAESENPPNLISETEVLIPQVYAEVREALEVSRISFYNPVSRQTDSTPEASSCGPTVDKQIALSRDLFFDEYGSKHMCGTIVTVVTDRGEVFSNYVINDTMHQRFSNTVDVMLPHTNEDEAFELGITSGYIIIH